jgi:hypothetical protein
LCNHTRQVCARQDDERAVPACACEPQGGVTRPAEGVTRF